MSQDVTGVRAFRTAASIFTIGTAVFVVLFVRAIVVHGEIRTGIATYGLITGLSAFGLWRRRSWGRSLALLITLASAGLGMLTLFSVVFAREGSLVVPAIVLVLSVAVATWLSRPTFEVPRSDD